MASLAWGSPEAPIYSVAFADGWGDQAIPQDLFLLKCVSPFSMTVYTSKFNVLFIFKHFIYKKLIYSRK